MSWKRITDACADDAGVPYLAGDLEGRDNSVWAMAPDLASPRWLVQTPVYSASLVTARGEIVVYTESLHQAVRLSAANGARAEALIGGGPSKGVALDFRNANSVAIDPNGVLVLLGDNRLRRFTIDGAEQPPWPGVAPASNGNDDKQFWQLGDRPVQFKTDHAFATIARDGSLTLVGWEGPCHLARYDTTGKRVQRMQLPFRTIYLRGRACIDGQGRVYVLVNLGSDEDEDGRRLAVLRISNDYARIERLIEGEEDRGELDEHLAVAPDGTTYLAGRKGMLHVFAPDGTLKYSSVQPPELETGPTANRGETIRALKGNVRDADRAEADEPDLPQMLTYYAILVAMPVALYFFASWRDLDTGAAAGMGIITAFFLAPAIIGWFGMKRMRWLRLGTIGRSICGVLAAALFASWVLVFAGIDPLGLRGEDAPSKSDSSKKDDGKTTHKKKSH